MKFVADKLSYFPDPRFAGEEGVVLIGDEISSEILLEAYSFGIFPWPYESLPLWCSPDPRGVLDFDDVHISRTLKKAMSQTDYQITYNKCFSRVIEACAKAPRPEKEGTWIISPLIKAYKKFHHEGYVHSVECWVGDELVGGLYGVYVAGIFSGESMFYRQNNASKYCLVHLIEKLKSMGCTWMDIQMVTENLKALGGKYISREKYLNRVQVSRTRGSFVEFSLESRRKYDSSS